MNEKVLDQKEHKGLHEVKLKVAQSQETRDKKQPCLKARSFTIK